MDKPVIRIPNIVIAANLVIGERSVQYSALCIVLEESVKKITVSVHRTALREFMVTCVIKIAVVTVLQRNVINKVEPALEAVRGTGKGINVTVGTIVVYL